MSEELPVDSHGKIIVFGAKQIRRIWHDEQWFFSVVDIIDALTDSDNPRNYWSMMKARELKQSEIQLSTFCEQLKLTSSDGKASKTDSHRVQNCPARRNAPRCVLNHPRGFRTRWVTLCRHREFVTQCVTNPR